MILRRNFTQEIIKKDLAWHVCSHGLILRHSNRDKVTLFAVKDLVTGEPLVFGEFIKSSLIICPHFDMNWRIEQYTYDTENLEYGKPIVDQKFFHTGSFKDCLVYWNNIESILKEVGVEIVEPDVDGYSMELGLRIRWHLHFILRGNEEEKAEQLAYFDDREEYKQFLDLYKRSSKLN